MLDSLKEQIINSLISWKEKVEESESFQSLLESYNELPARIQKLLGALALVLVLFLLCLPSLSFYSSSSEKIEDFEKNRSFITQLFELRSTASLAPQGSLSLTQVERRIQTILQTKNLLPEQIGSITRQSQKTTTSKKSTQKDKALYEKESLHVKANQLNLKQAVEIGLSFQKISPLVRLEGLRFTKSSQPGYIDATYMIESYIIHKEPPPKKPSKKKRRPRKKPALAPKGDKFDG